MDKFYIILTILVSICTLATMLLSPMFKQFYQFKQMQSQIDEYCQLIKELNKMAYDDKAIELLILNHIIDGNHIEKIKETRNLLIKMTMEDKSNEIK